jgi:hypothetical protein
MVPSTIERCSQPGAAAVAQMWSEDEQWFDRFEQGASSRTLLNVISSHPCIFVWRIPDEIYRVVSE